MGTVAQRNRNEIKISGSLPGASADKSIWLLQSEHWMGRRSKSDYRVARPLYRSWRLTHQWQPRHLTSFKNANNNKTTAAKTISGHEICGDLFILSAGACSSKLGAMHNSTIATGQVLGYINLTPEEMLSLKDLPIFINFDSGWFCFPPHVESGLFKFAVHG